jgi:hypothetical protein
VRELLITGAEAEGLTVMTNAAEPVPALFVADMFTLKVPAPVGVPVIAPVAVLSVSPGGNTAAP